LDRYTAELAMVLLGVTSAVLLVAYGLVGAGGTADTDPVFWLLALAFLIYVGWDIRRHLRAMRRRSGSADEKNP